MFNDAVSLVMYYMKRASSLSKEESMKIKGFLTQTLADFCYYPKYVYILFIIQVIMSCCQS